MPTRLPTLIVSPALTQAVTALAADLARFASRQPDCSLDALEDAVVAALRTAAPALLAATLQSSHRRLAAGRWPHAPRCPRCQQPAAVHAWRPRAVQTRAGTLQFARPWALCGPCGQGFSPTDTALGLAAQQRLSAGLRQLVVALGSETSFRAAARLLTQTTGLGVSPETVRTVSEAAGAAALAQQEQQAEHVARTAAAPVPCDPAPDQLVGEADGVMVRFQDGWHEVKVGVVGGWDTAAAQQGTAPHLQAPSYVALRGAMGRGGRPPRGVGRGGLVRARQQRGAAAAGGRAGGRGRLAVGASGDAVRGADGDRGLLPCLRAPHNGGGAAAWRGQCGGHRLGGCTARRAPPPRRRRGPAAPRGTGWLRCGDGGEAAHRARLLQRQCGADAVSDVSGRRAAHRFRRGGE